MLPQDMTWCQAYAFHNRRLMLDLLAGAVEKVTKRTPMTERTINIHHNYCQCESCSYQVDLPGWLVLHAHMCSEQARM